MMYAREFKDLATYVNDRGAKLGKKQRSFCKQIRGRW